MQCFDIISVPNIFQLKSLYDSWNMHWVHYFGSHCAVFREHDRTRFISESHHLVTETKAFLQLQRLLLCCPYVVVALILSEVNAWPFQCWFESLPEPLCFHVVIVLLLMIVYVICNVSIIDFVSLIQSYLLIFV